MPTVHTGFSEQGEKELDPAELVIFYTCKNLFLQHLRQKRILNSTGQNARKRNTAF